MTDSLIDRIYECSFAPDAWPGVFDALAERAGALGGCLMTSNGGVVNWTSSEILRRGMSKFANEGYYTRSSRVRLALAADHAGFITDYDVYTDEELQQDPLYRDVLRPAGMGWCAATVVPAPTGDVLFLTVEREHSRGPVERSAVAALDALRPHLARAALISARLQLEQARSAAETLASIGLPALVFDGQGRVLAANRLTETLTDCFVWRAHGSIALLDPKADGLFQQAIAAIGAEDPTAPLSFALRASKGGAAMVAHIVPLRRSSRDLFLRCAGILVFSPVTLPQAPPVDLVRSLFDLTPAEARVARDLTTGQTVEEIAAASGVSINTVRSQVRGVLEKTGSRRQTEAVSLLGGIVAPYR